VIYRAYQTHADLMEPVRAAARWTSAALSVMPAAWPGTVAVRYATALCEMVAFGELKHGRLPFGIASVCMGQQEVAVREEAAAVTPFATLLHFRKEIDAEQPRVLVVAPLSGHFATLLRGTIETLLPEHDVYVTDWYNARDVELAHGRFGLDEYVDHVIQFLEVVGPGAHVIAVCQPCVQVLAAVAIMAEGRHPAQPRSMTLMAGPIDTRVNPTKVNQLATSHSLGWFARNLIDTVPLRFRGARRRVYPGFLQLAAFMNMNLDRHLKAQATLFHDLVLGNREKVHATKAFYDEYFRVLDLPAEFYLETVRDVFQEHRLPLGRLQWRGQRVEPAAIQRTALLTVEGEKDDICAVGQTLAAHDLCRSVRPYRKRHHLQAGVGHYGVFSGKRWTTQVYPIVRNLILAS
jgi:poly(3-hydroxybutyrate) depolymerase